MMKTEIISIGDELLIGQVVNSNASFLGEQLSAIGVAMRRVTVVGDSFEEITQALDRAMGECDIIITTGGLGPTHDDITREAVTRFFSTELQFSEEVFSDIQNLFQRMQRNIANVNRDQAMVPVGARIIRNGNGTAPGYHFEREGSHLFVLPGVPYEMKGMTDSYIIPFLSSLLPNTRSSKTILTTSIAESVLARKLQGIEEMLEDASLAYLPSPDGVRLRATTWNGQERLDAICSFIQDKARDYIFSEGTDTLEAAVGRMLVERGMTLAVAESCTGGMLANKVTNVPGSSQWFDQGMVTYSNSSKVRNLGVDASLIETHGAVSRQVAIAMADGIRRTAGSGVGISTTGVAGPTGGSEEKPVGLVWIGISADGILDAFRFYFGDNRLRTKQRASQAALDIVRRHLLGLPFNLFPNIDA